jgi:hypothetical protein
MDVPFTPQKYRRTRGDIDASDCKLDARRACRTGVDTDIDFPRKWAKVGDDYFTKAEIGEPLSMHRTTYTAPALFPAENMHF